MVVQGTLDLVMGLGLIAAGLFVSFGMRQAIAADPEFQQGEPPPQAMFAMLTWGYIAIGSVASLIGAVNVYAGFRNWKFRDRKLGIVAMFLGLGTVLTCYCVPTSAALLVYGLIVYLDPAVIRAFRMRSEGFSPYEIQAGHSAPSNPQPPPPSS